MSAGQQQSVIVVGGGLAGLAATVRIAESGIPVSLFSLVPVKRSHSVCAQGGINACNHVARQQGYSEFEHFDETIYGGDFLQDQPPVYEMAHWAPRIIDLLDRMGVPFNRTNEGLRQLRLFGGSLYKRTHFAGATTGQQLMYALDEQVRRYEAEGRVRKFEFWEFLRPVIDDAGVCQGIVAQDLRSMKIEAFRAEAVVIATGGCGLVFGKSTNSVMCTGAAAARCYRHGTWYGNPEFVQVHPTAIPGADKLRLMSESARGEGGRVWVPAVNKGSQENPDWQPHPDSGRDPRQIPENERWYFLEEKYPAYGNIVPRDIATREIFNVCMDGFGVGGGNMVYLDLTHKSREFLEQRLGGIMEIYRKFVGEDPVEVPMKIFPGVHYSMGGLWTDFTPGPDYDRIARGEMAFDLDREWDPDERPACGMEPDAPNNMMTNIRGLYAFGEVNYQYHGANRLGANALLSCIFDGLFCGRGVVNYVRDRAASPVSGVADSLYQAGVSEEERVVQRLIESRGSENAYQIGRELGEEMTTASTVVKSGPRLEQALEKLAELKDRYQRIGLAQKGMWTNQNLAWSRAVGDMLVLADAILRGGLNRTESRGAHFRTDYPERDDEHFLKSTVAGYDAEADRAKIWLEDVRTGLVKPRKRTYGAAGSETKEPEKKQTAGVS